LQPSLLIPFHQAVKNLFPDAPIDAGNHLVLPHDLACTTILRRMGMQVPAPILTQYTFTGNRKPFDVQKITCELLSMNKRAYVLSGMGVGKTACPLWTFDYLRRTGHAKRMLIVAPLSTLEFVWLAEMLQVASPYSAVVLHGSRKKRFKLLAEEHDFYIINHDGVEIIEDELKKRPDINMCTIDELATFRNNNDRTKCMKRVASRMEWVWGMTGSPTPQQPTDVWNQANIVTPATIPKHFTRFREEVMYKINNFKWVPRPNAAERAYEVLQPSVRFTLEDVGELPGYISRRIDVGLGPKQHLVYETIRKNALAILNGGETLSATNKGVLLNKLLQIALGYVYTDTKGVVVLDNTRRIQTVLDIIEASENPLLVFCSYKHALKGFYDAITHAGWDAAQVSGDTPFGRRSEIFADFQSGRYKCLVAHPQCLAHGLTLTVADTIVWTGPIASLEIYDQANARIRRTGQTRKQQFLHIQGSPAEVKLYSLLVGKQDIQNRLLSLFEEDLVQH
jgi:SNF2 family DNA or RNA helicase